MDGTTNKHFRNQSVSFRAAARVAALVLCLFAASNGSTSESGARARWIAEGEKQERIGDHVSAINAYERALQGDFGLDADLFLTLARLHREMAGFDAAIDWIARAQAVYEDDREHRVELHASTLHERGWIYFRQGDYNRATEFAERALTIRRKLVPRRRRDLAASLNLEGLLLRENTEYAAARAAFDEALLILADGPNHPDRLLAQIHNNLGGLDYYEANFSAAITRFRAALKIQRHALAANHPDIAKSLNNLAVIHQNLGDLEHAALIYKQALAIQIAAYGEHNPHVGSTLYNMATVAEQRGNTEHARTLYEQSLNIYQKVHGDNHPVVAMNLTQLGELASRANDYDRAVDMLQRALDIAKKIYGKHGTWIAEPMIRLASATGAVGNSGEAHSLFLQSIRIAAAANERKVLTDAYAAYANHLATQNQTPAAILFGKLAVRTIESVRAELTPLGAKLNRSYLGEHEPVYRQLAQRLLHANRLAEASDVLQLLKYDEYLRFAHSPVAASANESRLVLTSAETAVADQLDYTTTKRLVSAIESLPHSRGRALGNDTETTHKLAANAARVQYLVEGDMLSALVTRARSRFAVSVTVSEASLRAAVSAYQQALKDPHSDPLPQAQQLYTWMLRPLEDELAAQKIDTLLLSLDGPLRYVPVAAIHDGERWAAEKFRTIRYSHVSPAVHSDKPQRSTMAAFGVSEAEGFAPLPRVANELDALVKSSSQDAGGILPGELYVDDEFTLENLLAALSSGHPLVHLASHFVLQPGSLDDSYLVIGGGVRLTLEDLRASDHTFDNTRLLTLAACNTAAATENAFGREIDGLGMLAQEKGARAVLASLWSVADRSTQRFMQTFYRLHAQEHMTISGALRATQVSLITGRRAGAHAAADYRLAIARSSKTPYAHPFYWAPFVLMQADP